MHVGPDASDLCCVCLDVDLSENLGHRTTAREPVLHQRIETGGRDDLTNDVIYPVASQCFPHVAELAEQPGHDLAFTGIVGDEIVNHRLLLLTVAMDATHTLLKSVRIPRNVVVHHQRTELEVDTFTGGFGGNHH